MNYSVLSYIVIGAATITLSACSNQDKTMGEGNPAGQSMDNTMGGNTETENNYDNTDTSGYDNDTIDNNLKEH